MTSPCFQQVTGQNPIPVTKEKCFLQEMKKLMRRCYTRKLSGLCIASWNWLISLSLILPMVKTGNGPTTHGKERTLSPLGKFVALPPDDWLHQKLEKV